MTSVWSAALFAVFVWWFATGAILLAVRWADRRGGHGAVVAAGLPLLGLGGWLVWRSLGAADVTGVYLGFLGALAVWGWVELAFLAGVVTGPFRAAADPALRGWARFSRAFATVAYHELALVAGLLVLAMASTQASNRIALATYLVLFLARICAKLNLFYGVPRINLEFVPLRLTHLKTYFTKGPLTVVFPITITILTALVAVCAERFWTAGADVTRVGFALLTAMSALALLEHWLMVIPLPDAKLWRWMLPSAPSHDPRRKT